MIEYKEEYWAEKYKNAKTKREKEEAFLHLIKELDPIIHDSINSILRTKSLDKDNLYYEAIGIIKDVIPNWDPRQSKLSTYIKNNLMRLHRTVYKYGQPLKLSESTLQMFGKYQEAINKYEDIHGHRNYSAKDLAELSGLPEARIKDLMKYDRNIFNTSQDLTTNIGYRSYNYKYQIDLLDYEFKSEFDPLEYKVWKRIKYYLEKDENPSALKIVDDLKKSGINVSYKQVNKVYNKIVEKLNNILSFQ